MCVCACMRGACVHKKLCVCVCVCVHACMYVYTKVCSQMHVSRMYVYVCTEHADCRAVQGWCVGGSSLADGGHHSSAK